MGERRGSSLRLTMFDLFKLVIACSVACACITPSFRLFQYGIADIRSVVISDAIIVPLVLVLFCYSMVQCGLRRDVLIAALVLFVASGLLFAIAWSSVPVVTRLARDGPRYFRLFDVPDLALALIGVPLLAVLVIWLIFRLIRLCGFRGRGSSHHLPLPSDSDAVESPIAHR